MVIKKTEVIVKCGDEDVEIQCLKLSFIGKVQGLMFSKIKNSDILLFEFKKDVHKSIHSFFVGFHFIAIWLDKDNNILETKIIAPWTKEFYPKKEYRKLIEIPMSYNNKELSNKIMSHVL